jgi:hypothetical protein
MLESSSLGSTSIPPILASNFPPLGMNLPTMRQEKDGGQGLGMNPCMFKAGAGRVLCKRRWMWRKGRCTRDPHMMLPPHLHPMTCLMDIRVSSLSCLDRLLFCRWTCIYMYVCMYLTFGKLSKMIVLVWEQAQKGQSEERFRHPSKTSLVGINPIEAWHPTHWTRIFWNGTHGWQHSCSNNPFRGWNTWLTLKGQC